MKETIETLNSKINKLENDLLYADSDIQTQQKKLDAFRNDFKSQSDYLNNLISQRDSLIPQSDCNTLKISDSQSFKMAFNEVKSSPIDEVVSPEAIRQLDELSAKLDVALAKQEKLLALQRDNRIFIVQETGHPLGTLPTEIKADYFNVTDGLIRLFIGHEQIASFPPNFSIQLKQV